MRSHGWMAVASLFPSLAWRIFSYSLNQIMSHSSSVSVTNVNVYVKQTNQIGSIINMPALSAPQTVSQAAMQFEKAVIPAFEAQWKKVYPNTPLPAGNVDFGYMGPWGSIQPGKVPACAMQQIALDVANWQLPTAPHTAARMAQTISQMVVSHGGQAGINSGATAAGANETIDWMVLSGQVYITPSELGVCYIFGAALSVDIG